MIRFLILAIPLALLTACEGEDTLSAESCEWGEQDGDFDGEADGARCASRVTSKCFEIDHDAYDRCYDQAYDLSHAAAWEAAGCGEGNETVVDAKCG